MPPPAISDEKRITDEQMLSLLKAQIPANGHKAGQNALANEKLRLQKVYKLFKWTNGAIRKFGHDRLDIILESYRIMGYISRESCDEIKEISRLMPANLGDEHEVGPDEFVSELYALNRILSPNDSSLDRDMIEVMMEQRQQVLPAKERPEAAIVPGQRTGTFTECEKRRRMDEPAGQDITDVCRYLHDRHIPDYGSDSGRCTHQCYIPGCLPDGRDVFFRRSCVGPADPD